MRNFSYIGLMKMAGPNANEIPPGVGGTAPRPAQANEPETDSRWREFTDSLYDGGVNLAHIGMNIAKMPAWAYDRLAGMAGYDSDTQGWIESHKPAYRNEYLATDPMNTAVKNVATGATVAAGAALAGAPALLGKAVGWLSPALVPAANATAATATVASPFVSGVNGYFDQKESNRREAESQARIRETGRDYPVIQQAPPSTWHNVRRGVGKTVDFLSADAGIGGASLMPAYMN